MRKTILSLALFIVIIYAALIWWTLAGQAASVNLWSDLRTGEQVDYFSDTGAPCRLTFDWIGQDQAGQFNRLTARCNGALVDRLKVYENKPYVETPDIPRIAWLFWGEVTVRSSTKSQLHALLLPQLNHR